MRVLRKCDGRRPRFAVKGFGAILAGSIHGNGWVHCYGTASWNHAMKAKASSCSTTACCEQTCPATAPPTPPYHNFICHFSLRPSPLRIAKPLSRVHSQSHLSSRFSLPFSSLMTHSGHSTVPPPRVLISSPTLRVKPDRLNGLQRGKRLAQKEKKQSRSFFEVNLTCRLLLMMLSRRLLDDRQQFDGEGHSIPSFPHPSGIYIRYGIGAKSDETERGRHFRYHQLENGRAALSDVSQDLGVTMRLAVELNASNPSKNFILFCNVTR